jgi:hypothetical protein
VLEKSPGSPAVPLATAILLQAVLVNGKAAPPMPLRVITFKPIAP